MHERAINEDIDELQELSLFWILQQNLEGEAGKAPDGLLRLRLNGLRQLTEALSLKHRIAAREGYVSKWITLYLGHDLRRRHLTPLLDVPRLRVMTTRTGVRTPRTIDGGPESRTVHHCVVYDVQNRYHQSFGASSVP